MRYNNLDYRAAAAAERARLDGDEDGIGARYKYCPVCGSENPEEFYSSLQSDECIGCSECVDVLEWEEY